MTETQSYGFIVRYYSSRISQGGFFLLLLLFGLLGFFVGFFFLIVNEMGARTSPVQKFHDWRHQSSRSNTRTPVQRSDDFALFFTHYVILDESLLFPLKR